MDKRGDKGKERYCTRYRDYEAYRLMLQTNKLDDKIGMVRYKVIALSNRARDNDALQTLQNGLQWKGRVEHLYREGPKKHGLCSHIIQASEEPSEQASQLQPSQEAQDRQIAVFSCHMCHRRHRVR